MSFEARQLTEALSIAREAGPRQSRVPNGHSPSSSGVPRILISGATGNVGAATVKALYTTFRSKVNVVAGVRDQEKAMKTFASLKGLELIHYDTNIPSTLEHALSHVDAVFIIPPNPGANTDRRTSTLAQIDAAKKVGVKFILLLDVLVSGDDKFILGREWGEYVKALQATGIPSARLVAPMFVENLWGSVSSLKGQGAFYFPISGDAQWNYISVSDVGNAAAALLVTADRHVGHTYTITGPSLATNNGIATELSRTTGRDIKFYQATAEQAVAAMTGMGFPDWQAKAVVELWNFHAAGQGRAILISNDYYVLTGHQPTDINEFLKHYYLPSKWGMLMHMCNRL